MTTPAGPRTADQTVIEALVALIHPILDHMPMRGCYHTEIWSDCREVAANLEERGWREAEAREGLDVPDDVLDMAIIDAAYAWGESPERRANRVSDFRAAIAAAYGGQAGEPAESDYDATILQGYAGPLDGPQAGEAHQHAHYDCGGKGHGSDASEVRWCHDCTPHQPRSDALREALEAFTEHHQAESYSDNADCFRVDEQARAALRESEEGQRG